VIELFEFLTTCPYWPNSRSGCFALVLTLLIVTLLVCVALWFWDPSERSCGLVFIGLVSLSALVFTLGLVLTSRDRNGAA